jgi:hypothetical protein
MLKLRQLPKLISKLLLHLRNIDIIVTTKFYWADADLDRFGAAITQVLSILSYPPLPFLQI